MPASVSASHVTRHTVSHAPRRGALGSGAAGRDSSDSSTSSRTSDHAGLPPCAQHTHTHTHGRTQGRAGACKCACALPSLCVCLCARVQVYECACLCDVFCCCVSASACLCTRAHTSAGTRASAGMRPHIQHARPAVCSHTGKRTCAALQTCSATHPGEYSQTGAHLAGRAAL